MCGSSRIPAKSALQPLSSYDSLCSTCFFTGTPISLGPVQVRIPQIYMLFHMYSNFTATCTKSLFLGIPNSLDSISTQDTLSYMFFFPCPTQYASPETECISATLHIMSSRLHVTLTCLTTILTVRSIQHWIYLHYSNSSRLVCSAEGDHLALLETNNILHYMEQFFLYCCQSRAAKKV
jgi:hypothetical protein